MPHLRRATTCVMLSLAASCRPTAFPAMGGESGEWTPGTASHSVSVGSATRSFLLHIPPERARNRFGIQQPFPLVILLHGSGADGQRIRRESGMDSIGGSLGFLVAYPNGSKGRLGLSGSDWNAGSCCGAASNDHVDDVGFLRALVERVAAELPVNRRRIYVAGFSDGGRMAYRVACESAPSIAAVGVVSGSLLYQYCAPARPVPLIAFHGTGDEDVSYNDSTLATSTRPQPASAAALPPSVRYWAAENGCRDMVVRRESAHVTRATFAACTGAEVTMYTVEGGAHAWPGEPDSPPPMSELRTSEVMVRFFLRHAR